MNSAPNPFENVAASGDSLKSSFSVAGFKHTIVDNKTGAVLMDVACDGISISYPNADGDFLKGMAAFWSQVPAQLHCFICGDGE